MNGDRFEGWTIADDKAAEAQREPERIDWSAFKPARTMAQKIAEAEARLKAQKERE